MSSTWGIHIKLSIFGGSHTEAIGVVIDGLPAGETIDFDAVLSQMARRAPGRDKSSTPRKESDIPHILSGLLDGVLTGAPLAAVIENSNTRSKDYSELKVHPRPGHADYTASVRYKNANDIRGGGHFSGRLTACMVFAGAVCRQLLEKRGVVIGGHVLSVGNVQDQRFDPVNVSKEELSALSRRYFPVVGDGVEEAMRQEIESARMAQDSVGGVVECAVVGMPAGIGSPMFGGVENVLASIIYGVPAVKGVEFGDGFGVAALHGSENNDPYYYDEAGNIRTRTNHAGGIQGGITNGMPLVFRAAFKPTASIAKEQDTVNLQTGENTKLVIHGRHDPCIVPRAAAAVEAAACVSVLELLAESGLL